MFRFTIRDVLWLTVVVVVCVIGVNVSAGAGRRTLKDFIKQPDENAAFQPAYHAGGVRPI